MIRIERVLLPWSLALVAGFAIVLALGQPLPTPAQELDAALHPATPVSREVALQSAATVVRFQYQQFERIAPTIERRIDAGVDRWVVSYVDPSVNAASGLNVSVSVEKGIVEVVSYP
jgi:hypothetical protein